jgi:hypothetical protein
MSFINSNIEGLLYTQGRKLYQIDDLALFCLPSGDHSSHFVSLPSKLFFSTRFFKVSSATTALSCSFSLRIASTSGPLRVLYRPPSAACLPPGTPYSICNTYFGECPASLPIRSVLFPPQNISCASCGGSRARLIPHGKLSLRPWFTSWLVRF